MLVVPPNLFQGNGQKNPTGVINDFNEFFKLGIAVSFLRMNWWRDSIGASKVLEGCFGI